MKSLHLAQAVLQLLAEKNAVFRVELYHLKHDQRYLELRNDLATFLEDKHISKAQEWASDQIKAGALNSPPALNPDGSPKTLRQLLAEAKAKAAYAESRGNIPPKAEGK